MVAQPKKKEKKVEKKNNLTMTYVGGNDKGLKEDFEELLKKRNVKPKIKKKKKSVGQENSQDKSLTYTTVQSTPINSKNNNFNLNDLEKVKEQQDQIIFENEDEEEWFSDSEEERKNNKKNLQEILTNTVLRNEF